MGAPSIGESPVCLECVVTGIEKLGTHDLFIAKVVQVSVDERYLDEKGRFVLEDAGLVAYVHGTYLSLGKKLGTFGFSVRKKERKEQRKPPLRDADRSEKRKKERFAGKTDAAAERKKERSAERTDAAAKQKKERSAGKTDTAVKRKKAPSANTALDRPDGKKKH